MSQNAYCDRPYTESVGSPPNIFKYIVDISGGGAPNTLLGTPTHLALKRRILRDTARAALTPALPVGIYANCACGIFQGRCEGGQGAGAG